MSDLVKDIDTTDSQVQIIIRQTNYTYEEAEEKLKECNFNHIDVIKSFLGIKEKPEKPIKSVNQEIYRQLRHKLDASMSEYNTKKEKRESL
jgi:hypothetical protein